MNCPISMRHSQMTRGGTTHPLHVNAREKVRRHGAESIWMEAVVT